MMKSSLSVALVAITAVSAENFNYANYQNEDVQYYQYNISSASYYDEYFADNSDNKYTNKNDSIGDDPTRIQISNCENSVVQVTNVNILCDSPYRTYYSNGAHMASEFCDYGDKAIVMVFFEVEANLNWMDNIYMTFAIYAGKQTKELVWAVRSVELCHTFVGHACNLAGRYAFAFQVYIDYAQMSDRSLFIPMIEMGFSTQPDEGYNLGGVNIDCKFNSFYRQYHPFYNSRIGDGSKVWGAGSFDIAAGNNGLYISFLLVITAVAFHIYFRRRQGIKFQGNTNELVEDASA